MGSSESELSMSVEVLTRPRQQHVAQKQPQQMPGQIEATQSKTQAQVASNGGLGFSGASSRITNGCRTSPSPTFTGKPIPDI
mmetsp:Transcript_33371/g.74723  ORF Transcript_33371/g.74723 Transcript_33371/m.74723 type:complete len:82 (-) Transcript_33371:795-1040(-)